MHPTPDDTIKILLIGVMGRYCRYGLTQRSITWQQVGCIPCTTSFLVSLVHKMHPTFDDTITTANRCVERKAKRINRERCASPCSAHPINWCDVSILPLRFEETIKPRVGRNKQSVSGEGLAVDYKPSARNAALIRAYACKSLAEQPTAKFLAYIGRINYETSN